MCYGSEVDEPGLEWISPCQCRGATKWVHQLCLQQWVDEKQKGASSVDVNCPQCRFEYQIVYPDTSFLLLIYEHINNLLTSSSPVIIAGVAGSSLYWVLFTHGYVTTALALGKEEFVKFFGTQESSVVLVVLPLMPLAVLGLKLLRLEVYVIKASYWVAPVFYKLINKLSINTGLGNEAVQEYSFVPANVPVVSFLSRSILSTFFLPFISSSVGWFLSFVMKSSSSLRRTVVVSRFSRHVHNCYLMHTCIARCIKQPGLVSTHI